MSTFYDAPNDYRNYIHHSGVKGMKWDPSKKGPRKSVNSLRLRRIAQMRKTFNGRDERESHHEAEEQRRRTEEEAERARQHRAEINNERHASDRNAQTIAQINAAREAKIRREQELRAEEEAERERNRKRRSTPTGLSNNKELHRARVNGDHLRKLYNTRRPGRRSR